MIFTYYCDESHDSTNVKRLPGATPFEPKSYVVAGFFSDPQTWVKVKQRWKRKNELEGVPRYHASHLNARTHEYDGWSPARQKAYSIEILKILKNQGAHIHGVSCGLYADAYRTVISPEGRIKMGHPYLVCFKTVIATVAQQMDTGGFQREDRFSVVVDQGEFEDLAIGAFYAMKDHPDFRYRHRLAECTADSAENSIGLQPADFIAYETFRLMHGKRIGQTEMRKALRNMLGTTGFFGHQFGDETLNRIKDGVDQLPSCPDGLVIVPPES